MKEEKVYVYLEGHDFEYDLRALIKAYYPDRKIIFIKNETLVDSQSLLIESLLEEESRATIRVVRDGQVLAESESLTSNIDIKNSDMKRILKLGMKQAVIKSLSKIVKRNMPWGVLTGIRPTKIVHELIDRDIKKEEIIDILTDQYKLDLQKADLITEIALGERKHIYPLDDNKFSLYVSIPFCPTRCLYCSFPSNDIKEERELVDIYTEKVIYEIQEMARVMKDKTIDTVYIGGGTPTAIPPANLDRIIKTIYQSFGRDLREFTVEAGRPDTIDLEMLKMLKDNDIRRISINPQTMNDETLRTIGRNHTSKEIEETYRLAKELGFESINMDLIVGLPGEDKDDVVETMEHILDLDPENLTVHTMALKRTSKLREQIDDYNLTDQEKLEDMLNTTRKYTKDMNLVPYYMYRQKQILGNFENIGYAKKGYECIYNMLIMEEKQTIIAVGAGASSKIYSKETDRVTRVPNLKDLREYINRTKEMVERKRSEIDVN